MQINTASPALFHIDGRRVLVVHETLNNGAFRRVTLSDGCEVTLSDREIVARLDTERSVLHVLTGGAVAPFTVAKFDTQGYVCSWYFETGEQAVAFASMNWRAWFQDHERPAASVSEQRRRDHLRTRFARSSVTRVIH